MDDEFYNSEYWYDERQRVLEFWDGLCEKCYCPTNSPHVHHVFGTGRKIYEVLCPDCHAEVHDKPELATLRKKKPLLDRKMPYLCTHCQFYFNRYCKYFKAYCYNQLACKVIDDI